MHSLAKWLRRTLCSVLMLSWPAGAAMVAAAEPAPSLGEVLDLSSRLYQQGVTQQDPFLILAAARLRLSQFAAEREAGTPGWISGAAMLRDAETLAASDPALRAMISKQDEQASRGGLDGPEVTSLVVPSGGEVRLSHRFKGGAPAYVYAEGSLTTQLSVSVLDQRKQVCQTPVESGRTLCRWVPARDGSVTTVVRNLSAEASTVLVVTN